MPNDLDAAGFGQSATRVPLTQGPQQASGLVSRPGEQIGRSLAGIGSAFDAIGEKLDASEQPQARVAGENAVYRDPASGLPRYDAVPEFSASDRARNVAGQQAALAQLRTNADTQLQQMALDHQNDPAAYGAALKAFTQKLGADAGPEQRGPIRQYLDERGGEFLRGLMRNAQATVDDKNHTALTTRLNDETQRLYSLAFQGGFSDDPNSPSGRSVAEIGTILTALKDNPAFKDYPAEKVASLAASIHDEAQAQGFMGQYRREYEKTGDLGAIQRKAEKDLQNPDLHLTFSRRMQLMGEINEHLKGADAARTAETAAMVEQSKNLRSAYGAGIPVKDTDTDALIASLNNRKKYVEAFELGGARTAQQLQPAIDTVSRGSISDAVAAARSIDATITKPAPSPIPIPEAIRGSLERASAKTGVPLSALAPLVKIESGFDPNAANGQHVGLGQFGDAAWKTYGQGRSKTDPDANAEATASYWRDNAASLRRSLGRAPEDWEVYLSHQQGAGGAAALLANPDASAISVLSKVYLNQGMTAGAAAATAAKAIVGNGGTADMTASAFADRWRQGWIKAGGAPGASNLGAADRTAVVTASPAFRELVGKLDAAATDRGRVILADITRQADASRNYAPTDTELAGLRYFVDRSTDQGLKRDAARYLGVEKVKDAVGNASSGDIRASAAGPEDAARHGQLGPNERQALIDLQSIAASRQKVAIEEPTAYGTVNVRSGIPTPKPLDLASPDTLRSGMQDRQAILAAVKQREPAASDQVFSVAERKAMSSTLAQMQPDAAQRTVQTLMQGLRPEQLTATLADDGMKQALVGMTRDPAKMVAGFQTLDRLQQIDPMGFEASFGRDQAKRLALWQDRIQYLSPKDAIDFIHRLDDPAQAAGRDVLMKKSEELLKSWAPEDVAKKAAGAWFFGGRFLPMTTQSAVDASAMLHDFQEAHADFYSLTGDDSAAQTYAVKRVQTLYGTSDTSGGRLMKNPPEKFYPAVEGSWGWIGQQLDADVKAAVGPMGVTGPIFRGSYATGVIPEQRTLPQTREQQAALERYQAPRALFADRTTADEISGSRPPSYAVVIKLSDGRTDVLRDPDGKALRFRPDAEAALAPVRQRFEANDATARATRQAFEALPIPPSMLQP